MKVVACARRKAKLEDFISAAIAEGAQENSLLAAQCDVQKEEDIQAVIASMEVCYYDSFNALLLRCSQRLNSHVRHPSLVRFCAKHPFANMPIVCWILHVHMRVVLNSYHSFFYITRSGTLRGNSIKCISRNVQCANRE